MSLATIPAQPPLVLDSEKVPADTGVNNTDLEGQVSSDESQSAVDEKPAAISDAPEYPTMAKAIVIMLALYLCIFLVALGM